MRFPATREFGAALLLAFAAQAASADVTAQDVWSDWRDYIAGTGYQITATETATGNGLTVSDLRLTMQAPDTAGALKVEIAQIVFTENGDGTVSVALPPTIPVRFSGISEDDKPIEARIDYTRSGETLTVSGAPGDMAFDYAADEAVLALAELLIAGEAAPADMARLAVTLTGVASRSQMKQDDLRRYAQDMSVAAMSYDIGLTDPEEGGKMTLAGALNGLGFKGTGSVPMAVEGADMSALLGDGFAFDGTFTFGSGTTNLAFDDAGEALSYTSSSEGGSAAAAMDAERMTYDLRQKKTAIAATTSELPFPVSAEMGEAALNLSVPVAKSDEAQDFALGLTLGDFTMAEALWGMIDPAGQLPRDPASVVVDLSGKLRMLYDMFDPNVAAMLEATEQAPAEVDALTINKLLVSMVGAKLSGSGDFTFDNSAPTGAQGMPKPTGTMELQLVGGNGLIDKLIGMGMLSDQDAMGARMMLGMLAVPGDAPDTLNSKIEFNDQGHILANGQRIQ